MARKHAFNVQHMVSPAMTILDILVHVTANHAKQTYYTH